MTYTSNIGGKILLSVSAPVFAASKITYKQIMDQLYHSDLKSIEDDLGKVFGRVPISAKDNFSIGYSLINYKGDLLLSVEFYMNGQKIETYVSTTNFKGTSSSSQVPATRYFLIPKGKRGYHLNRDPNGTIAEFYPGSDSDRETISKLSKLATLMKPFSPFR